MEWILYSVLLKNSITAKLFQGHEYAKHKQSQLMHVILSRQIHLPFNRKTTLPMLFTSKAAAAADCQKCFFRTPRLLCCKIFKSTLVSCQTTVCFTFGFIAPVQCRLLPNTSFRNAHSDYLLRDSAFLSDRYV